MLPRVTSTRMLVSTKYAIAWGGSVAWPADAVFVRYAVRDVVAVGPHAEDRQIADGLGPLWCAFGGDMRFDSRAFGEIHILQRLEDAVLVRSGNRHSCLLLYPKCSVGRLRRAARIQAL